MFLSVVLYTVVTFATVIIIWMIPSVYDISSFTRVYDLFDIIANEPGISNITKPVNIVTRYYPSSNIQTVANVTYQVDPTSNTIKLKVNNIDYTYALSSLTTKQIIYPLLLGAQ